jgi:very-short-patch-repair endonuclease
MSTVAQLSTLRRLARAQHGVLSLEQARAAGLSDDTIRRRVASKAWRPAGVRVFQVAEHDETPASRTVAAMLSIGDAAVLVGRSAAWWWDLHDRPPAWVEVAVGREHQVRPRDGVDVTRRDVDPADRARHRRLATTTRACSVLDAAVRLGLNDGAQLMDRALVRRRVRLDDLHAAHHRAIGRHGAPLAGRLLVLAAGGARSQAERQAHRLMRGAGIRGWTADTEIVLPGYGRAVGDVVFEEEKVIVEIDGWAYHRDLPAFLIDGPRQSALAAVGWVVLRTHWHELVGDPDAFLAALRRTLATRSRSR